MTAEPGDPPARHGAGPYRHLSLWWDAVGTLTDRPALAADLDVDVCIVGAGFTGLWTAHALLRADPGLRVVVIEAEVAGFGASGRNGGWCSALFAATDEVLEHSHGRAAMAAMHRAMTDTVDEVGRAARDEGIDCHFAKGGMLAAARTRPQLERGRARVEQAAALGLPPGDLVWLGADEARRALGATDVLGATYSPHCAALQPALLARGLADAVERGGATVYEHTRALAIEADPGSVRPRVRTHGGTVRADVVVRALEGWTPTLAGTRRAIAPLYSLMIATEPLDDGFWAGAGLEDRATFADLRHMIIYGQRTADGRIAFGGRGAPYHFGSAIRPSFDRVASVHQDLARTLVELFPALAGVRITHTWGGPLGVPRDWCSSVGLDRASGLAWAGGYVGDGVSTANLAGRTLADLIVGRDTDLVHLPWVGHRSPDWEPEPLRWLGVNAGLWTMERADRSEVRHQRPSRLAARMERILGH